MLALETNWVTALCYRLLNMSDSIGMTVQCLNPESETAYLSSYVLAEIYFYSTTECAGFDYDFSNNNCCLLSEADRDKTMENNRDHFIAFLTPEE